MAGVKYFEPSPDDFLAENMSEFIKLLYKKKLQENKTGFHDTAELIRKSPLLSSKYRQLTDKQKFIVDNRYLSRQFNYAPIQEASRFNMFASPLVQDYQYVNDPETQNSIDGLKQMAAGSANSWIGKGLSWINPRWKNLGEHATYAVRANGFSDDDYTIAETARVLKEDTGKSVPVSNLGGTAYRPKTSGERVVDEVAIGAGDALTDYFPSGVALESGLKVAWKPLAKLIHSAKYLSRGVKAAKTAKAAGKSKSAVTHAAKLGARHTARRAKQAWKAFVHPSSVAKASKWSRVGSVGNAGLEGWGVYDRASEASAANADAKNSAYAIYDSPEQTPETGSVKAPKWSWNDTDTWSTAGAALAGGALGALVSRRKLLGAILGSLLAGGATAAYRYHRNRS